MPCLPCIYFWRFVSFFLLCLVCKPSPALSQTPAYRLTLTDSVLSLLERNQGLSVASFAGLDTQSDWEPNSLGSLNLAAYFSPIPEEEAYSVLVPFRLFFSLQNMTKTPQKLLLQVPSHAETFTAYLIDTGNKKVEAVHGGEWAPPGEKAFIYSRFHWVAIELQAWEKLEVLINYQSIEGYKTKLSNFVLYDSNHFKQKAQKSEFLTLLFGIVFLIMSLYNLSLYFGLREKYFLYYSIMVFGLAMFISGTIQLHIFPYVLSVNFLANIFVQLVFFGSSRFTDEFLGLRQLSHSWHRIFHHVIPGFALGLFIFLLLITIGLFPPYFRIFLELIQALGALGIQIAQLWVTLLAIRRKFPQGKYYLLASSPFYLSSFIYIFIWLGTTFGLLEQGFEIGNIARLIYNGGLVLQIILFSQMMAFWFNRSQEKKVEARTYELKIQKEEIAKQRNALTAANEQLRKANLEKDKLMGVVAHDLRSPMSRVKGLLEVIKMEQNLSNEQQKYMSMIDEVVVGGQRLIQDLLDVSSWKTGSIKVNPTAVELVSLHKELITNMQPMAVNKNIQLHFLCKIQTQRCTIDGYLLQRILENILSNAIKFSPQGKNVFLELQVQGAQFITTITDEGPGFSLADKSRLFNQFQRLSAQPTGGENSSGLGLYIVKKLVDALSGEIVLTSSPGNGAAFSLTFPLQ